MSPGAADAAPDQATPPDPTIHYPNESPPNKAAAPAATHRCPLPPEAAAQAANPPMPTAASARATATAATDTHAAEGPSYPTLPPPRSPPRAPPPLLKSPPPSQPTPDLSLCIVRNRRDRFHQRPRQPRVPSPAASHR